MADGPIGGLTPRTSAAWRLWELVEAEIGAVEAGAARHDADGSFPLAIFDAFGRTGILGATVPAMLGGLGVDSLRDLGVVLARLARADASVALALHVQLGRGLAWTAAWQGEEAQGVETLLRGMA